MQFIQKKAINVKRGQSALEFLMTYGWAILIILVMITALVYFGVFNPSRLTPEKCTATPGFGCIDYRIINKGLLGSSGGAFVIQNAKGTSVMIIHVAPTQWALNLTNGYGCTCTVTDGTSWASDSTLSFNCIPCDYTKIAAVGDKQKATVTGYYVSKGSTFTKSFSVDINSVVMEG